MVTRLIPRALWMAEGLFPARYCKRIRARSTSRTGAEREACRVSSRFSSSGLRTKAGSLDFPATLPTVAHQTTSVNVLMKRCTSERWRSFHSDRNRSPASLGRELFIALHHPKEVMQETPSKGNNYGHYIES